MASRSSDQRNAASVLPEPVGRDDQRVVARRRSPPRRPPARRSAPANAPSNHARVAGGERRPSAGSRRPCRPSIAEARQSALRVCSTPLLRSTSTTPADPRRRSEPADVVPAPEPSDAGCRRIGASVGPMSSRTEPDRASMIHARGLVKRFGDFTAVDGIDVDVAARRGVRLPRPQRRRQVLDDADDRLRLAGRPTARCGCSASTRARDGPRIRARLGVVPQEDTLDVELTVRENLLVYGRYFGLPRADVAERADRAARVRPARRAGRQQGRAALRRHEAPAHHRPLADQRARHAAARRADDRPRPAGPARALGPAVPAQAAGRDARAHDALHGRGRAALRPAGGHGRRPDRGRGLARAR